MPPRTSKKKASSSKEAPQTPKRKSRNDEEATFTPMGTPSQSLSQSLFSLSTSQAQLSQYLDEGEEVSDVLSGAYISEGMTEGDLSERMKKISDILKGMGQLATPDDAPWDELFISNIIEKKIISNKTEEVRVYAACSIVDILRVTAPDCPFEDEELPRVFKFIIEQIEALSRGGVLFSKRFYLLERLSTVKIFIMLVNIDEGEGLIIPLFQSLFRIVTDSESTQPQKVISYICDIMITLIESIETVDSKLIEVLIQPLLENRSKIPSEDDEDEDKDEDDDEDSHFSAKYISKNVLDKTQEHLSNQLNDYLNDILKELDVTKDKTKSTYKKKRARVFSLIYEINLISSRLLLTVIPNLCIQLKDEEVQVRSAVIQLLGNMFKAKESELFKEYPNIFETDFLSRFTDKDNRVRIYMSKFASGMIKNHPSSNKVLNERLEERIMDPDEKVRRNVVETIINIAMESPALVSDSLMQKLKERTRDKKAVLRLHALELCAKLYNHHATEALKIGDSWENTTSEKLAWIPNTIIKLYAEQHEQVVSNRLMVEKLIDQELLAQDSSRTKTLLDLYTKLDQSSKHVLSAIISQKKSLQHFVNTLIHLEEDDDSRLPLILNNLSSSLPDESVGKRVWKDVFNRRNKQNDNAITTLKSCLNTNITFDAVTKLKKKGEEKILGEKKEEKDYMKTVIQKLAMTIFTKEQAKELVKLAHSFSDTKQIEMTKSSIRLFNIIVQAYPAMGKDSIPSLIELFEKEQDYDLNILVLKALSQCVVELEKTNFSLANELETKVVDFCTMGKPKEVKRAAEVITKAFTHPKSIFSQIIKEAKSKMNYGEELLTSISAFRQVAIHDIELFRRDEEEIVEFILNEVILVDREEMSSSWETLSVDTQTKVQGFKFLVDYCIACTKEGITEESEATSSKLVNILFSILKNKGSISRVIQEINDEMETSEEQEEDDKKESKKREIDRAALRLIAANSIIKLTTSDFKLNVSMERFLQLAFVFLDTSVEVKRKFVEKLFSELMSTRLSTRFTALLILFVGDKNAELAVRAKSHFSKVVTFFRALISKTKGITLTSPKANDLFPEYILPYLVFLLSHHPQFKDEAPQFMTFQKILYAYFDEVTHDTDNLSFFHHLITKLKQRKDSLALESTNHLIICDMSVSIVNRCAESSGSSTSSVPFPGKVFIPPYFVVDKENESNLETIKTLFLPDGFKLNEKLARQVQPVEKKKKPTKVDEKKDKKRKRTTTKKTTKKKKEEKESTKRSLPSRSAKTNRKKIESEDESEEEEEEEEEEQSEGEEQSEQSEEEEEEEEEKIPPRTSKQKKEPKESVSSKKKKFK